MKEEFYASMNHKSEEILVESNGIGKTTNCCSVYIKIEQLNEIKSKLGLEKIEGEILSTTLELYDGKLYCKIP